ncbi:hypothetical protein N9O88_01200 [bacterium]|nr:hypothetical protein [bacterium]
MAQPMPIELPSPWKQVGERRVIPPTGPEWTITTVYLGKLADQILHHIKNGYSSKEIQDFATFYSRIPFGIRYNDEEDAELLILPPDRLWAPPGVILFNKAVKKALDPREQARGLSHNVTKNQIILILCELIPGFFPESSGEYGYEQVRDRLEACPLCTEADRAVWADFDDTDLQRPAAASTIASGLSASPAAAEETKEETAAEETKAGGGKKRRRSGLKSHRRIRTRHKSNKKTKHKKRKQKKTKRKKMRRRK